MNLKKFHAVQLKQGPIYISYAKQGLFFSKGATEALHYAPYACMKIDFKDRKVLFMVAKASAKDAVPFYHNRKLPGARWTYSRIDKIMLEMMGWNPQIYAYRVPCLYIPEENALLADFNHYRYTKTYDSKKHKMIAPRWRDSVKVNLKKDSKRTK